MSQQNNFQGAGAGAGMAGYAAGGQPNAAVDVNQAAIMSNQNRLKNMSVNDLKAKMMESNEVDN